MKKLSVLIFAAAAMLLGAEEIRTVNLSQYIRSRYKAGQRDITLPDGKVKCTTVTLGKEFKDLTIRGGKNTVLINTRLTTVVEYASAGGLVVLPANRPISEK